jgi:DNA-binding MarR family transcriptional regulator
MSPDTKSFARMVAFIQETHRAAEAALAGAMVTPAQFFILSSLRAKPGMSQVELAEALGVTAGNVSQLVAKLEAARLVARAGQGRAKLVSLTASGERLVARLAPEHEEFLRGRFAALSAAERKTLSSLLEKLVPSPAGAARGGARSPRR